MKEYGLSDERDRVKSWYDGFTFGQTSDIYNPWSIINFLGKHKLSTYWANTSSNSLVGKKPQCENDHGGSAEWQGALHTA